MAPELLAPATMSIAVAKRPSRSSPAERAPALLEADLGGDARAAQELVPLVYEELKRLAGYHLRMEAPGQTLQATALVHEAYLRLVRDGDREWAGRTHFFAVSSRIIRHLLVDQARETRAAKRGGRPNQLSAGTGGPRLPRRRSRRIGSFRALRHDVGRRAE